MLESSEEGYPTQGLGKMSERCRPDYEGMIKSIKEKLDKTICFRDAALDFFEGNKARDKMAELIGELVTLANKLQREYDSIIEAQEKDTSV